MEFYYIITGTQDSKPIRPSKVYETRGLAESDMKEMYYARLKNYEGSDEIIFPSITRDYCVIRGCYHNKNIFELMICGVRLMKEIKIEKGSAE